MNESQQPERVDLRVRTKQFALRVIRLFSALPKRIEAEVIGKQVLRSGTSVGANFREAHRARSDAEFVSKVGDCLQVQDLITVGRRYFLAGACRRLVRAWV